MKKDVFNLSKILTIFIILIISFFPTTILAKQSLNAQTTSNKTSIVPNDNIEVTLKFTDFVEIEKGLNAYKSTIQYDKNIFEELTEANFSSRNNWERLKYNANNNEFIAINRQGITKPSDLLTITFHVKKNAPTIDTEIKFNNIVTSNGKGDISVSNSAVNISIVKDYSEEKPNNTPNTPNKPTPPSNNQTPETPKKTSKRKYLPIFILISIIELSLIYIFIKRRKDEEDKNNQESKNHNYLIIAAISLASIQFVGSVSAYIFDYTKMGELNGDSVVNYLDVDILENHLIAAQKLASKYFEYADMNFDKKITVTDLSLLLQKCEKTLTYKAEIKGTKTDKTIYEKNETATIYLTVETSYEATIKSILINNQSYNVKKENNANLYSFKLNVLNIAGSREFIVKEITLNNNQKIKTNYSIKLEVLKDIPKITDYLVEDDISKSIEKISFNVVDNDFSITSAKLTIVKDEKIIQEFPISNGKNQFSVNVIENQKYDINIQVAYNRTEKEPEKEEYKGQFVLKKDLFLKVDYQFTLSDLATYSADKTTNYFEKLSEITLGFMSTNATAYEPVEVTINNKTYDKIEKKDNRYYLTIPGFANFGKNNITIENIKLANGKAFTLKENNTITVDIVKRKPEITNFDLMEDIKNKQLKVNFNLKDDDQNLENLEVTVFDGNNTRIDTYKLTPTELTSSNQSIILNANYTDKYKVEITATYSSNDKKVTEVILTKEFASIPQIDITNLISDKSYYEKNENITLTYNFATNQKEEISKIRVNNINYPVTKLNNNSYQITIPGFPDADIKELKTTKIIFASLVESDVLKTMSVEVLKDIPNFSNIKQVDNKEKGEVIITFDLDDIDNAFLNGTAVVTKIETQTKQEYPIKKGKNELNIPLENAKLYKLELKATYDRDKNSTDNTNLVENAILNSLDLVLLTDYELQITNLNTYKNNAINKYFTQNEDITIGFESTNISIFNPVKAVINGKTYELITVENKYYATIPNFETAGITTINLEKIILSNTHEENITNQSLTVNILKDPPRIERFNYERISQNRLRLKFNLVDKDNAFLNGNLVINLDNQSILNENLKLGENIFEFDIDSSKIVTYNVVANATYNLDTAKTDRLEDTTAVILNKNIELSPYVIELKDVIANKLYYKNTEITKLDITKGLPTDLENYYVKIEMENLPTYYANVGYFNLDNNQKLLSVVLDQNDFIMYNEIDSVLNRENKYSFNIAYEDKTGIHSLSKDATAFFENLKNDPNGTHNLTEDLDATNVPADLVINFRGTINGNNHRIKNLKRVLFNELNKATVKDLIIENAIITDNSRSFLATTIKNGSEITNVHILNSSMNNYQALVGGLAGILENSIIKQSSVVNISIRTGNTIGGIAGQMNAGSIVEDCYVTGSITGTVNNAMGARVGGITGWHTGTKINRVYTNITVNGATSVAGLIGGPNGGSPVITNALSAGNGGKRLAGWTDVIGGMTNVYEFKGSTASTHITEGVTNIKEITNLYDKNFYKNTLGFDESVWNLDLITHEKLPVLKNGPMSKKIEVYEVSENKNKIPNYKEIRLSNIYQKEKELAYYNLSKLKPFADTRNWLELGNSLNPETKLVKEKIKFIVPLTRNNNLVLGLNNSEIGNIAKIRVVYENQDFEIFNVTHFKTIDNLIPTYKINDTNLEYEYDNYLANIDQNILNNLLTSARNLDYATGIASITEEEESRLYVDFYNESVKGNLTNILKNYLLTNSNIPSYITTKYVQEKNRNAINIEELKQFLYTYNYYEKWYHLDLDGIKLSDFIFFNGYRLNNTLTTKYLMDSTINTTTAYRSTNQTTSYFNNYLSGKIGMNFYNFFPFMFKTLNGYNDPSDWIKDHFKGILHEQPATDSIYKDEIIYRAWPIMNRSHTNWVLPMLSAPNEDMYIITAPTQLLFGTMNRYGTYINKDGNERTRMATEIAKFASKIGNLYGTSSNFIPNSAARLNAIGVTGVIDTRFFFPQSPKANAGDQERGVTQEPVIKWVYEAIGTFASGGWAAAYANGYNIFYVYDTVIANSYYGFDTLTHETAHNQDGSYFYSGNGRRGYTRAEAHADGVITQNMSDNFLVFNLVYDFPYESNVAVNLSYTRINSSEKIHSYYKEMFETKYVLEYLNAQAFLRLTPAEQAAVAVQMDHPSSGTSYGVTYTQLTAADFQKMNLKTIEDLWNNRIAIRKPGSSVSTSSSVYTWDSFFHIYYYTVNNPEGSPDYNTFKTFGWEMLGYAGYDKGFIGYMSGRNPNDLAALRNITNNPTMTYKTYKLSRYETVKNNLSKVTYFNPNEIIKIYEKALKTGDSNNVLNVTRLYYGIVKRATNDFTTGNIYNNPEISITSAEQLVKLINENPVGSYRLTNDIDFSRLSPVENQTYYINQRFMGVLNGNGYKIKGLKYTLFSNMVYAHLKNVQIDTPTFEGKTAAYLSLKSTNCSLENVRVTDSNVILPDIITKSGWHQVIGEQNITVRAVTINTVQDFLNLNRDDISKRIKYTLNKDLDFAGIDIGRSSIVEGVFTGSIEGNNHKLKNIQNANLFNELNKATVKNLVIENSNNTNTSKSFFANTIKNGSEITNVHILNSTLNNGQGQVGGFTGYIESSTIKESSAVNIKINASNTIGGIAGQTGTGSIIEDCYVTGSITGTLNNTWGARVGGITGWHSGAKIDRTYTNVTVAGPTSVGGLIGGPNSGTPIVTNSISLGNGGKRLAGWSNMIAGMTNVYENKASTASTHITSGVTNIKEITNIYDRNFYKNTLGFNETVWNLDVLKDNKLPTIKNGPVIN